VLVQPGSQPLNRFRLVLLREGELSELRPTRHTSHVTRHTSHVTRHTSHVTCARLGLFCGRGCRHASTSRMKSSSNTSSPLSSCAQHQNRFPVIKLGVASSHPVQQHPVCHSALESISVGHLMLLVGAAAICKLQQEHTQSPHIAGGNVRGLGFRVGGCGIVPCVAAFQSQNSFR
jgi:hypothetical protein